MPEPIERVGSMGQHTDSDKELRPSNLTFDLELLVFEVILLELCDSVKGDGCLYIFVVVYRIVERGAVSKFIAESGIEKLEGSPAAALNL
ncbi:hypothetical protein B0J17DRAFT_721295 [Rhizoctonia solani]|nr:hypothetical protein B0J17DRAFT_721295 [Rhizoctonia solani]